MLIGLLNLIDAIVALYFWTLLAYVIVGWLIVLRIAPSWQPVIYQINQGLAALHQPLLRPIRNLQYRLIPNMGGFDLSPIIALLIAQYIVKPLVKEILISFFT